MTLALGAKAPLNFAVFTGVGGALLLATCERFPLGLDALLLRRDSTKTRERGEGDEWRVGSAVDRGAGSPAPRGWGD